MAGKRRYPLADDAGPIEVLEWLARHGKRGANGCLIWQFGKSRQGYGYTSYRGMLWRVHRLAYYCAHGRLGDQRVLHSCDVRACFELEHLQGGDHAENMRQMVSRGRAATGDRNAARLYPESRLRGQRHPGAKLDTETVSIIRARRGERQRDLAREYGVSQRTIQKVLSGVTYV